LISPKSCTRVPSDVGKTSKRDLATAFISLSYSISLRRIDTLSYSRRENCSTECGGIGAYIRIPSLEVEVVSKDEMTLMSSPFT
jgi:hypothetical protein